MYKQNIVQRFGGGCSGAPAVVESGCRQSPSSVNGARAARCLRNGSGCPQARCLSTGYRIKTSSRRRPMAYFFVFGESGPRHRAQGAPNREARTLRGREFLSALGDRSLLEAPPASDLTGYSYYSKQMYAINLELYLSDNITLGFSNCHDESSKRV